MTNAAIYVRVSSKGQEDDGSSLGTQEAACRSYAAEHGYDVTDAHVYREVFTGIELWERPELTRLRAAISRHDVGAVVVYSIDRLSRDPVHLGVVLSEADHHGCDVAFVSEPLDHTPEGQLIRFVRGYAAKVEHEKIRERTIRGKRARAESGKLMHACRALYGFQWRDETKAAYDIHPINSVVVRRIFAEYVEGYSLRQIVRSLMADQIPSPTGLANWGIDPIRRILRHPAYTGRAFAWGYHRQPGKRASFDAETAIALPAGTIPELIAQPIWDRAQARLESNKHCAPRDARIPAGALLLRGHIRCAECLGLMSPERYSYVRIGAEASAGTSYMYRCRSKQAGGCRRCSIAAAEIDAAAWEIIVGILTKPMIIAAAMEQLDADDAAERDLAAVDTALATLLKQRANLVRIATLLDVTEDAAPIVAELEASGHRLRQLQAERETIAERHAHWQESQALLREFAEVGALVGANAAELPWEDRLALVELLGIEARVGRKDAEERWVITTRFSPEALTSHFGKVSSTTPRVRHFPEVSLRFSSNDLAAA